MRKLFFLTSTIVALFVLVWFFAPPFFSLRYQQHVLGFFSPAKSEEHLFAVQSIDTMKYSRDISGQVLDNPAHFKLLVDKQMALISGAGATHVAIGTPYDAKFLPVLRLWVASARAHHLSVWFRGNFSGWEGWFDYQKIDRDEHKRLLKHFLTSTPDLFINGDVFTPCPECENGGTGDPRQTGDVSGYNNFLIEEKSIADAAFALQHKIITVYPSMNADIAKYVISDAVTRAFGGTVLIDHYVRTPEQFASDIQAIPQKINAQIGLGEIGAPIPDLNGDMTEAEQATYVDRLFAAMYMHSDVIPVVNYWVLSGGTTALVNDDGSTRKVYEVLQNYFKAVDVHGTVRNSLGENISTVTLKVKGGPLSVKTTSSYQIFIPRQYHEFSVEAEGYASTSLVLPSGTTTMSLRHDFFLQPVHPSVWYKFMLFFNKLSKK